MHCQVSSDDPAAMILNWTKNRNALLFEEAFYAEKNLNPKMEKVSTEKAVTLSEGIDAKLLSKVLVNPGMVALLSSLAKSLT